MRTGIAVLLSASVFLALGFGCEKGGGNRTAKGSSSEPMGQTEVAHPTETAMPAPKPDGTVSLKLVPENPDALTGLRAELAGTPPGARMLPENLRWFVNGVETEVGIDRLQGNDLRRDDIVHASATVEVNGQDLFLESPPVTVQNAHPETLSADLSPNTPRTGELMRVACRGRDVDGDPVTIRQKTLPEGVVLSGTVLTGDVSSIPPGTKAPVVLRISDGDGGDIEYSFRLTSSQK